LNQDELCFVVITFAHNHKPSSLPGFLSGIRSMIKQRKLPALPEGDQFHDVLTGISKWFASSNTERRAASISAEHLIQLHGIMDGKEFGQARDYCAYIFAFLAVLRISEYTGTDSLQWRHVQLARNNGLNMINVSIPFSKTASHSVQVTIVEQPDELCPVRAFKRYQRLAGKVRPYWPLFLSNVGRSQAMGRQKYMERLRSRLTTIGESAATFSGHSFRRGGLTALLLAGVSDTQAQRHGRWSSNSFRKYFDTEFSVQARAAATASLAQQRRRR
jgi:hypothetical protein